jgi:elongation of very long chain fatty acids protein 6
LYDFVHEQLWFPFACVALYLAFIYYGPKYFETRPPWNCKTALAAWNFALSIFSFFGFIRCLPFVVHNISTYGFEGTLCNDPENSLGQSITGVWVLLFVVSKIP